MPSGNYFRLVDAVDVHHWFFHRKRGDKDWHAFDLDGSNALAGQFPLLTIECEHAEPVPDYFRSGPRPIVSDKFRQICERCRAPAEFLPIKVLNPSGQETARSPFWLMHLLERIDCIDYERSIYVSWSARPGSEFRRIEKLVLHDEAVGDRDLFKPQRFSQPFVSERLRAALLVGDCVVRFVPLEEVRL
jgi:hypothetical protein